MQVFISVVLPAYNRPDYTKIAIESVLRQTYANYELLVTDDSTNDEVQAVVRNFKDARIRYVRNLAKKGIASNTYNGLSLANGTYVAFLNDDDFWEISFLEELVTLAIQYDLKVAFCDHWIVDRLGQRKLIDTDENTEIYKRNTLSEGPIDVAYENRLFIDYSVPIAMGCIIKKEIINLLDYPNEIGGAYDKWIFLQLITNSGRQFGYIDKRLSNYRVHSESASAKQGSAVSKSVLFVLNKALDLLTITKPERVELLRQHRSYVNSIIKHGQIPKISYWLRYLSSFLL